MTNFSSADFKSTGNSASRTIGDRFADIINVKDCGAKGDGSTDDTNAIKTAWARAFSTVVSSTTGAIVFFPPGIYVVSSTISLNRPAGVTPNALGARIVGSGEGCTYIQGSVTGYIFTKTDATTCFAGMQDISVKNTNYASGNGGAQLTTNGSGDFSHVSFDAFGCCDVSNNSFGTGFVQCAFNNASAPGNAPAQTGSFGCLVEQASFMTCSFTGFDIGLGMSDSGIFVGGGSRFEVNNTGIQISIPGVLTPAVTGFAIIGNTFEGNLTAIDFNSAGNGSCGIISGCIILGESNSRGQSVYGINAESDKCTDVLFQGLNVGGNFSTTAFNAVGSNVNHGNVVMGVICSNAFGGASTIWNMPTIPGWTFIQSNNPDPSLLFGNLPGQGVSTLARVVGDEYNISNCPGSGAGGAAPAPTFGQVVTATGSASFNAKLRWNGSNWTVSAV